MRIPRRAVISGLCAAALDLTVGCKKKPNDSSASGDGASTSEIIIGHYASMTGSTAHFGQDTDRGVRLAIDEANAKGGVLGKKIRVVTLDTRGDSAEAASAVNRLIDLEKVTALLGDQQAQQLPGHERRIHPRVVFNDRAPLAAVREAIDPARKPAAIGAGAQ